MTPIGVREVPCSTLRPTRARLPSIRRVTPRARAGGGVVSLALVLACSGPIVEHGPATVPPASTGPRQATLHLFDLADDVKSEHGDALIRILTPIDERKAEVAIRVDTDRKVCFMVDEHVPQNYVDTRWRASGLRTPLEPTRTTTPSRSCWRPPRGAAREPEYHEYHEYPRRTGAGRRRGARRGGSSDQRRERVPALLLHRVLRIVRTDRRGLDVVAEAARTTAQAPAGAASFVAAASSFYGGNIGLGALFSGNGALFVALYVRTRATDGRRKPHAPEAQAPHSVAQVFC